MKKGNKKIIRGWVMYDWANSVYNLVISSAIFPIFYDNVTTKAFAKRVHGLEGEAYTQAVDSGFDFGNVTVQFFGAEISNSVLISYVLSGSFLVVSFLSPMLSGVADFSGNKKRFMQFFCYLGALSCISLYWFSPNSIELGMLSIFLGSIGFWNSLVFYNAYLPEIAAPKDHDRISARGFSMGYLGSMLLLVLCLSIIMFIDPKYTSISFLLVGLWWIGFSQITYRVLPNNPYKKKNFIKRIQRITGCFQRIQKDQTTETLFVGVFLLQYGGSDCNVDGGYICEKRGGLGRCRWRYRTYNCDSINSDSWRIWCVCYVSSFWCNW